MNDNENAFVSLRSRKGLKLLAGLRGSGKSEQLRAFAEALQAEGVDPSRILFIDAEAPTVRRMASCDDLVNHVETVLPHDGVSFVLIREVSAIPEAETFLGFLAASSRYEVFLTSSTRQIVSFGLGEYLAKRLAIHELTAPSLSLPEERCRALWDEIFLRDVLSARRILEVNLAIRIAGYLSDHLGDSVSLRQIANAVSPPRKLLSPHTVEAYLSALSDAYLVEKVARYDLNEGGSQATRYRYFFTSLALRNARFGPAPEREEERLRMNEAWLRLRRTEDEVYVSSTDHIDFISCTRGLRTLWRLAGTELEIVARDAIGAK